MSLYRANLYRWIRDLHLYFGLFISPFILVFAVSTLLFNHTWKPWATYVEEGATTVTVEVPEELEGIEQARAIMRQAGVSGEIQNIFRPENRLIIPVMKPGQRTVITVDLTTKIAEVKRSKSDFWEVLLYLHKSPGPHNANIRGNWVFTRIWTWLTDTAVYTIFFLSASGIYLWAAIKAERKIGLILIGAGGVSFIVILSTVMF